MRSFASYVGPSTLRVYAACALLAVAAIAAALLLPRLCDRPTDGAAAVPTRSGAFASTTAATGQWAALEFSQKKSAGVTLDPDRNTIRVEAPADYTIALRLEVPDTLQDEALYLEVLNLEGQPVSPNAAIEVRVVQSVVSLKLFGYLKKGLTVRARTSGPRVQFAAALEVYTYDKAPARPLA